MTLGLKLWPSRTCKSNSKHKAYLYLATVCHALQLKPTTKIFELKPYISVLEKHWTSIWFIRQEKKNLALRDFLKLTSVQMHRWMKWRRLQKIDSKNDYPENWNLRKTIVTTFVIMLKLFPTANWFLLGGVISSKFKSMFVLLQRLGSVSNNCTWNFK